MWALSSSRSRRPAPVTTRPSSTRAVAKSSDSRQAGKRQEKGTPMLPVACSRHYVVHEQPDRPRPARHEFARVAVAFHHAFVDWAGLYEGLRGHGARPPMGRNKHACAIVVDRSRKSLIEVIGFSRSGDLREPPSVRLRSRRGLRGADGGAELSLPAFDETAETRRNMPAAESAPRVTERGLRCPADWDGPASFSKRSPTGNCRAYALPCRFSKPRRMLRHPPAHEAVDVLEGTTQRPGGRQRMRRPLLSPRW